MFVRDVKYFRAHKVHELTKEDYELVIDSGMFYVFYPEACGIYEEDVIKPRIDVIGQNGNDGLHYDNLDGVGWPYEMDDSYIDKVSNVTQEHFEAFVGCLHDFVYNRNEPEYDVFKCIRCGKEIQR